MLNIFKFWTPFFVLLLKWFFIIDVTTTGAKCSEAKETKCSEAKETKRSDTKEAKEAKRSKTEEVKWSESKENEQAIKAKKADCFEVIEWRRNDLSFVLCSYHVCKY